MCGHASEVAITALILVPGYFAVAAAITDSLFVQSMELYTGLHLSRGNAVQQMLNGVGTYPQLWKDLRAAKRTITVQMYYSQPGEVADTMAAVLKERARAGVRVPPRTRILVAPFDLVVDEEPLAHEKLCPVLGVVRVPTAHRGIRTAAAVLRIGGAGHSAVVHSTDPEVVMQYAAAVDVLRVTVNAGGSTGSAGFDTNLAPSMTIGTGSWPPPPEGPPTVFKNSTMSHRSSSVNSRQASFSKSSVNPSNLVRPCRSWPRLELPGIGTPSRSVLNSNAPGD